MQNDPVQRTFVQQTIYDILQIPEAELVNPEEIDYNIDSNLEVNNESNAQDS